MIDFFCVNCDVRHFLRGTGDLRQPLTSCRDPRVNRQSHDFYDNGRQLEPFHVQQDHRPRFLHKPIHEWYPGSSEWFQALGLGRASVLSGTITSALKRTPGATITLNDTCIYRGNQLHLYHDGLPTGRALLDRLRRPMFPIPPRRRSRSPSRERRGYRVRSPMRRERDIRENLTALKYQALPGDGAPNGSTQRDTSDRRVSTPAVVTHAKPAIPMATMPVLEIDTITNADALLGQILVAIPGDHNALTSIKIKPTQAGKPYFAAYAGNRNPFHVEGITDQIEKSNVTGLMAHFKFLGAAERQSVPGQMKASNISQLITYPDQRGSGERRSDLFKKESSDTEDLPAYLGPYKVTKPQLPSIPVGLMGIPGLTAHLEDSSGTLGQPASAQIRSPDVQGLVADFRTGRSAEKQSTSLSISRSEPGTRNIAAHADDINLAQVYGIGAKSSNTRDSEALNQNVVNEQFLLNGTKRKPIEIIDLTADSDDDELGHFPFPSGPHRRQSIPELRVEDPYFVLGVPNGASKAAIDDALAQRKWEVDMERIADGELVEDARRSTCINVLEVAHRQLLQKLGYKQEM